MITESKLRDYEAIAARAVDIALREGADGVESCLQLKSESSVRIRCGRQDVARQTSDVRLAVRVFRDSRVAIATTCDLRDDSIARLLRDLASLCRYTEPDDANQLPEPNDAATEIQDLDLYDDNVERLSLSMARELCLRGEQSALDHDPRIVNSHGASLGRIVGGVVLANSHGFLGSYRSTFCSMSIQPIADDDGTSRHGTYWTAGRFLGSLEDAQQVGEKAARRAVAMIGARPLSTRSLPVIFSPEAGRQVLGYLLNVTSGRRIARGSSYLCERRDERIASPLVTIVDDPLIPRAIGSRPFDGEGGRSRRNMLVDRGVFSTILCDSRIGRRLGTPSTGSAYRNGGDVTIRASNLTMQPGTPSRDELVASTPEGLYVMSLLGRGFDPVTGAFSHAAEGLHIVDGAFTSPVSEVMISANFDSMLHSIDGVANDLDERSSTRCPTFRVASMTVSGNPTKSRPITG